MEIILFYFLDNSTETMEIILFYFSDNSTETFWESGDEDRNKTKTINIQCGQNSVPHMCYVHIDNSRDLGVSIFQFSSLIENSKCSDICSLIEVVERIVFWDTS